MIADQLQVVLSVPVSLSVQAVPSPEEDLGR